MNIEHLKINLEKRCLKERLIYEICSPVPEAVLDSIEKKLNKVLPSQIRMFYKHYNGLIVIDPFLEILPIEKLEINSEQKIYFARVAESHKLCFDASHYNDAGQWNILNQQSYYLVTLTFASFWSNKIWAWIDRKKNIWDS